MYRATGLDQPAQKQVIPAILNKRARDRIGVVAVRRRPQPTPLFYDLAPGRVRKLLPHQFFREVDGRRDEYHTDNSDGIFVARQSFRQEQSKPAAHRRSNHQLRSLRKAAIDGETFLQPSTDRAVGESAA